MHTAAKGFGLLVLIVLVMMVLGGISVASITFLASLPSPNKGVLDAVAAVLAAVTAIAFAYSDTHPTADAGSPKRTGQESRRDFVKLITHGGAIVVTAYLAWAATGFPFLPADSPIRT